MHTVTVLVNTFYEFRLPTTITPRYISQFDQSKIVFEKVRGQRVEGCCYWSMKLKIKSSKGLKHIFSKTHEINPNFKIVGNGIWEVSVT